jgi:hypothetical protein
VDLFYLKFNFNAMSAATSFNEFFFLKIEYNILIICS